MHFHGSLLGIVLAGRRKSFAGKDEKKLIGPPRPH